jgi:hypothetical protein
MSKNIFIVILSILLFIFILYLIYIDYLNKYEHLTMIRNRNRNNKNKFKIYNLKNKINTIIDTNIKSIEINNINKIVNIYQEKYKNSKCPGIGDFIRGSYFVIQISKKFNIDYEIIINHPISNFLKNKTDIKNNLLDNIFYYQTNVIIHAANNTNNLIKHECIEEYNKYNNIDNIDDIINKLKDSFKKEYFINRSNTIYFSTNQYPLYKIQDDEKNFIKKFFEPNNTMNNYIDDNLKKLKLEKKKYIVIHFRTGDNYLIHKNVMAFNKYKMIIDEVDKIKLIEKNIPIIIISDNQMLKNHLKQNIKNVFILDNKITHLGEDQLLNEDNVKDTLLDFYIISNCKKAYSFTKYSHGSGFIQWNCITYNVPYEIKYINDL